jgi:hypothetical protein
MCDFLSIVVRRDGAVAHVPQNSHSGAVQAAGWRENDQMADMRGPFFVEAEWNPDQEKFPGVDKVYHSTSGINEKQRKAIEGFYLNAQKLFQDPEGHAERMCLGDGCFAGEDFADIRWHVLVGGKCPKRLELRLAATPLYANGELIRSWPPGANLIGGNVVIAENCQVTAPALTKSGNVVIAENCQVTAPALTEVSGSIDVRQGATLTAPALTEVSGYIDVGEGATLTAPALTKSGYIDVRQGATLTAPALTEVSGYIDVRQGATLTAPALTKSGSIVVRQGATLTAPALKRKGSK